MQQNVIDYPRKLANQVEIKTWLLNHEIAEILSRYHEEEQFVAVIGVLLEMFRKNPTLEPALMKLLENRRFVDDC